MSQNQNGIRIRFHQTSEEVSIDMPTLHEWIASGRISAEDYIKGDILTNGEWKRADEMRIFYAQRELIPPQTVSSFLAETSTMDTSSPGNNVGLRVFAIACKVLGAVVALMTVIHVVNLISAANLFSAQLAPELEQAGVRLHPPTMLIFDVIVIGLAVTALLWAAGIIMQLLVEQKKTEIPD